MLAMRNERRQLRVIAAFLYQDAGDFAFVLRDEKDLERRADLQAKIDKWVDRAVKLEHIADHGTREQVEAAV